MSLHLEPRHLAIVQQLLQTYLPEHRVFAYGSRATGRFLKSFSDLDLAVDGQPADRQLSLLRYAFEESLLPMKVDLCDLGTASAAFRSRIEPDFIPIQFPVQAPASTLPTSSAHSRSLQL